MHKYKVGDVLINIKYNNKERVVITLLLNDGRYYVSGLISGYEYMSIYPDCLLDQIIDCPEYLKQ